MREIHLNKDQFKSLDELTDHLKDNYSLEEATTYAALINFIMAQKSISALLALFMAIYPDRQAGLHSPHDIVEFLYNNVLREASEKDRLRFLAEMVDE